MARAICPSVLSHRLAGLCHSPHHAHRDGWGKGGRGGQEPLFLPIFSECPWEAACGSARAEETVSPITGVCLHPEPAAFTQTLRPSLSSPLSCLALLKSVLIEP